jgi:hypothetical protein
MTIKKIAILLTFFIFVIVAQVEADAAKSVKNTPNRDTTIKMNENTGTKQKRTEPVKESARSVKKTKAGFQTFILIDQAKISEGTKTGVNFLKTLEEAKKFPLRDSLHKATYSYQFFQNVWKDRFLSSLEINGRNHSNSGSSQPISKAYSNGDDYFVGGKILPTFRLLQSKGDEPFKEIFMGFRFSFDPVSTHMLVEMNISPSSEKGPGVIIPF